MELRSRRMSEMTQRDPSSAWQGGRQMPEKLMRRYLLGDLKAKEKESFEETYFSNDSVYAALCGVEDELVDAYLCGRLSWSLRRKFTNYYLASPARVARVEEGRRVMLAVLPVSSDRLRFWSALLSLFRTQGRLAQLVAVLACLVVALGGAWLVLRANRLQNEVDQALEALRRYQRRDPAAAFPMPNAGLLTVILTPGVLKSGGQSPERTTVPAAVEAVRARLVVDAIAGFQNYRASLRTPEGVELWRQAGLKRRRVEALDVVVVILPTDLFTNTDYIIQLEGSADGGTF